MLNRHFKDTITNTFMTLLSLLNNLPSLFLRNVKLGNMCISQLRLRTYQNSTLLSLNFSTTNNVMEGMLKIQ